MFLFSFKKIAPLLLAVLMLLALTACQNGDAVDTVTTEIAQASTETATIESTTETTEATTESEPSIVEDFELTALDGTKTNLYQYKDQIIVLNFWATWCGFCVKEMPLLNEMDKRDDVTVIAVSVGEDAETVRKYIEDGGYDFDVYLDPEGTLASKFGVTGFPTSLFLGSDYEYFYSYPGMLEQDSFDSVLKAIDDLVKNRNAK